MTATSFTDYLDARDPSFEGVRQHVVTLLLNRSALPSFSASTARLFHLCQDIRTDVHELAAVIDLDPGLAMRCIRAASSVRYGARQITSIHEAILATGMRNVLQIAMTAGLMENMRNLSSSVDWRKFWFHSVLVARLTDRLGSTFGIPGGTGYLPGLLHDVGKILIQQNFPDAFEEIISHSMSAQVPHHVTEAQVLGLDHAQIGAAMCELIGAPRAAVLAVRYHHEPLVAECVEHPDSGQGLLAAVLAVANAAAKLMQAGFESAEPALPLEELPEFQHLGQFERDAGLTLNVKAEMEQTEADLQTLMPGRG